MSSVSVTSQRLCTEDPYKTLSDQLKEAEEREDYEACAILRDKLKEVWNNLLKY
jgi:protein-arginine kinase activator protein McsA